MIVVFERNKTERLQYPAARLASWTQKLGHAVYRPGLRLKGDFDEIALA